MHKKILIGFTTTPGSNWREKIKEIDKYGIKEMAFFPTFLKMRDRKEIYGLLEKTGLEEIPHVHLRDDMENWEMEYYLERYKTKVFNIHTKKIDYSYLERFPHLAQQFFVENPDTLSEEFFELSERYGGVCFDVSHFYDFGVLQEEASYKDFLGYLQKKKVGCCHISAISKKNRKDFWGNKNYSNHFLKNSSEVDYVDKYVEYLPDIISIELENSFEQQIKIKERLEKIINKMSTENIK